MRIHHKERHRRLKHSVQQWNAAIESYGPSSVEVKNEVSPPVRKCELCKESFVLLWELLIHVKTVHEKHCCLNCGLVFQTTRGFEIHSENVHETYMNLLEHPELQTRKKQKTTGKGKGRKRSQKKPTKGNHSGNKYGIIDVKEPQACGAGGHVKLDSQENNVVQGKDSSPQLHCSTGKTQTTRMPSQDTSAGW